jgi:Trypsin-like peptidase domain
MSNAPNFRRSCLLMIVIALLYPNRAVGQGPEQAKAVEDAKIASRIESFKNLPPEVKAKLSQDLQAESNKHYGFAAVKTVDDTLAIDVANLTLEQKLLLDQTTMHVVDNNLLPIAILKNAIKSTGNQVYPDLQTLIASSLNEETLEITNKVGRIRYWLKNGQPTEALQDGPAYLAGTGFVIGPGMVATACHVLDFFTDVKSGLMSPTVLVDIDFSADPSAHRSFLVTGVAGKGNLKGEDYAILTVSTTSKDGRLPDPVTLGTDTSTKYVGVIGYPDLTGATVACSTGGAGCDETNKWFADFAAKNPGIIKIISPGRKTGNFAPLGFPIVTYDSPTLGGQSGSPVIDLSSKKVIGIHYCCTGYA